MTGYSRADGEVAGARFTVEVKSVNHRYLDLKLHLPRSLQMFEQKMAELVRSRINRGRVDVWVQFETGDAPVEVRWNRPLARGLMAALAGMKEALGLSGTVDLTLLASQKDVILINESGAFGQEAWPDLSRLLGECLESLKEMRKTEGEALAKDISARVGAIESLLERISKRAEDVVSAYRDKLEKRINDLMSGRGPVDEDRLAQEAAIFADRSDITEEVIRAGSHFEQFRSALAEEGPKGRKLDFLVQEIFREANTISSKASDARVAGWVVEIKTELEKIREQVQNLE
jgi:uncharacterized protein (TIGR00255 family)